MAGHRRGRVFARAAREGQICLLRIARNDVGHERTGDRLHVEQPRLGIERAALPVGAADRAWQLDRALWQSFGPLPLIEGGVNIGPMTCCFAISSAAARAPV